MAHVPRSGGILAAQGTRMRTLPAGAGRTCPVPWNSRQITLNIWSK